MNSGSLASDLPIIILSMVSAFIASSGFWAYISKRGDRKSASVRLIMGLAHDKASTLGFRYIDRGYITKDELEDYRKYLYEPYKELGGNGVIERIMNEVMTLPISKNIYDTDQRISYDNE